MKRSTSYHHLNRKTSGLHDRQKSISNLQGKPAALDGKQSSPEPHLPYGSKETGNSGAMNNTTHTRAKGRKKDVLEKFIESPQSLLNASLSQLRHTILCEGLPADCPYRCYIWSILLRASPIESEWYSGVVSRGPIDSETVGPSSKYVNVGDKIKNDVFRTFQNNKDFWNKVSESEFMRMLNTFAWCVVENDVAQDYKNDQAPDIILSPYVQGMNVLAAPILYVCRSEPQAFALYYKLLMVHMPRYITPTLSGAMDGVKLVELVLLCVDGKLAKTLSCNMASAKIYALPSILTLSACTPSLNEVTKLWDFLFSFGVHMNVMIVVAQLFLIRADLMSSKSPIGLLRQFPNLNAEKIIKLSLSIAKSIPDDLYDLIVRHTYDESVSKLIDNYKI